MKCPACGHDDPSDTNAANEIVRCDECKTWIAFGTPRPRIVIARHDKDPRFTSMTVDGVTITLDRAYWRNVLVNVLSLDLA